MSRPRIFDARKTWLCGLIALAVSLVSYGHDPLIIYLFPIPFSLAGVLFGARALVRGPLHLLGGIFLFIHALLLVASVGGLFFPRG
jgi:hypothetical protein